MSSPQLVFSFSNELRREAEIKEMNICEMAAQSDSCGFERMASCLLDLQKEREVAFLVLFTFFLIFSVSSKLPQISINGFYSGEGKKLKNLSCDQYILHTGMRILEGYLPTRKWCLSWGYWGDW